MTIRPRSIRAKLLLLFLPAAALPIAVLGVIFYRSSTQAVAEMVGNRTAGIVRNVRAELDGRLTLRIEDRLLGANQPVQDFLAGVRGHGARFSSGSLDTLGRYLDDLFAQYGEYYEELVLADAHGEPLMRYERASGAVVSGDLPARVDLGRLPPGAGTGDASTQFGAPTPLPTIRESDRSFFHLVPDLAPGEHLLRADPAEGNRGPTVGILRPVQSNDDPAQRLGYLLARVRSRYLWPDDWANRRFGEKGHLIVLDESTGKLLYHTRSEWIGRDLGQVDPDLLQALSPARAPHPNAMAWSWIPGGAEGRRVAAVLSSTRAPWKIVATAVPGEFAIEARRAALFNLLIAGGALMVASLILLVATGRLSRSIVTLTAGARRIAGGDFGGPAILAETHDEIQTLAEAFNFMSESVRRNIAMREEAAAELDALNRSLEGRVRERTRELEALNAALNQANEQLKELDRLKSHFLATVSHEFKTPLTSIKAFAEILHDELEGMPVPEEMRRFLAIIDAESDRLGRLIKNVLDLSRIESGRMVWRMADVRLEGLIDAALDGLLPALREKALQVERDLPEREVVIHGDPDRLQEVFTNVLDNAIQASGSGQSIVIGCREDAAAVNGRPRMVRVSVRDRGQGIAAADLERIFDRFHQVSQGKRRKGGTGLGLAICREIAEYHGGRIWAESEPGAGATFHITLPCAAVPEGGTVRAAGPATSGPNPRRGEADA
jgi:signal transduction histidine kinase